MTVQVSVLALTTGSCLLTGLLGLAVLHALRRRRVVVVLVLAALVPVLAVAVSVAVNVQAMFISVHDSQVMVTALVAALVTAVVLAVVVGRWLVAGSSAVGRGLQVLGAEEGGAAVRTTAAVPAELAALDLRLQETSRRLEASRRRERNLEVSRRELVAFLSHDLRSPLAGLRALTEGIEDGVVEDVPEALVRMRLSVDRMNGMVDDLFELSRLHAPDTDRVPALLSLREVAEDITRENHESARAVGVHLDVDADDRLPVVGVADELARALSNLIGNALRHTAAGGSVRVLGDRDEDGRVRLSVLDGCGGIDPDQLGRVFDTGWRGDPERTPGDGRAGLGLAIARGVAEAHAGSLLVQNTPVGCRFELILPAAARETGSVG